MKGKIYIAGPMAGIDNLNKPAFDLAAAHYRQFGWEVFNPAEHDYGDDRVALGRELAWICEHATAICMLSGWESSGGAFAEWALARRLGLDIRYQ